MSSHAAHRRLPGLAARFRTSGFGQAVARTAGFNMASTMAAGLGGVLIARVLGPSGRGEYAAITSWFGVTLMVGGLGQPAALCFYVARDPDRAPEYVATARLMMLVTGTVALTLGMILAPLLAHSGQAEVVSYRIAFAATSLGFVGASYTFSLQARDLKRWNVVRVSQPVLSLLALIVLWRLHLLTLQIVFLVLAATTLIQLAGAYWACRRVWLAPGHLRMTLIRPLITYGIAQIAAIAPATLNIQLDQLIMSQAVPAAELGRYAVAVSFTMLPMPMVTAIGNVAFPRLAAERGVTRTRRNLQRVAVLGSAGLATVLVAPLALTAYWLVPLIFGAGYEAAVPLIWILTPGAVFLACGQVAGDVLRGRNQPADVAWAQGLAAVFTVILLVSLLPVIGVYGASIASTIAYGLALLAMLLRLRRSPQHARGAAPLAHESSPPPQVGVRGHN